MTQLAQTLLKWIFVLCVLLSLTACAVKPKVITEFEVAEKQVAVKQKIPANLLDHPEECWFPPRTGPTYIFDWDEWNQCVVDSVKYYYRNIESIKNLEPEELQTAEPD